MSSSTAGRLPVLSVPGLILAVACGLAPTGAAAQTPIPPEPAASDEAARLEARIAELESALVALRAEVAARRESSPASSSSLAPPPVPAPVSPPEAGFRMGDRRITMGGFVKADMMVTRYGGGDPAGGDLLRDFHLPGAIPVGGTRESLSTDFSARQTRLWLAAAGAVGGHQVGGRLEMDFQVLPGAGDQRTTSPSNLSLRRAFVTVDNWLIGQEWTNFQNVAVLPDAADYVAGVADGTVFARQVQVRYTHGRFSIAAENPETTVTPLGGGARITADDNSLPDLTARYAVTGDWGEASVAGVLRQLRYENPTLGLDAEAMGWGLSAAGRFKLGRTDDVRLMLTVGEGVGRYVGLNFANDAVLDAGGELQPIGVVAGFVAYRRVWSPQWRSNLIGSAQKVDNPGVLAGPAANRSARSLRANLIWSPGAALDMGAEVMYAERELESGASGDMSRLQLFVKYGF